MAAVIDLLTAGLPADVKVYHSRVTDPTTPQRFVIVTGGDGKRTGDTWSGAIDEKRADLRLTISACLPADSTGTPGPMAEWLVAKVEDVLTGARPVIAGKRPSRIRHVYTRFMGADEGLVGLISAYYVSDYSLTVS